MSDTASRLAAWLDGAPLPEDEARALWKEFSEHMDAHRGDMAGFAVKKGWFSVLPEHRDGKAVLMVRTSATAKMARGGTPSCASSRSGPTCHGSSGPRTRRFAGLRARN